MQPPLVCVPNIYVLGNMPDRKTPYMLQYLFNVQRELGASTALEIGYLGSRSNRLERMFDCQRDDSRAPAAVQSRQAVSRVHEGPGDRQRRRGQVQLAGREAHPAARRRIVGARSAIRCRSPTDNGSGIRTLNGDTLFPQNSYCFECEWGLSIFDVRHRFVASVLYELPFGDGKPFLQSGVGGAILGGWQISTIISTSSGFPRTGYVGTDRSNTGGGQDRPNTTGTGSESAGRPATVAQWFNTAAFALQPPGTWGNAGRNTFFGPGINNVDMSIIRNFPMPEQEPAVPARGVQRVQQADLERPEHDVDQPAVRHDQQHETSRCASCSSA